MRISNLAAVIMLTAVAIAGPPEQRLLADEEATLCNANWQQCRDDCSFSGDGRPPAATVCAQFCSHHYPDPGQTVRDGCGGNLACNEYPNTTVIFRNVSCKDYCDDNGCTPGFYRSCPPGTKPNGINDACGCNGCIVAEPTCGENCLGNPECEACECGGGTWTLRIDDSPFCNEESPVLIDLVNADVQFNLTSVDAGVPFDIDADGVLEQVAWTSPSSTVAFLSMDRNGNGTIDSGAELFGNRTPSNSGGRAAHGFEALRDLDGDGDGRITAADAAFAALRVWVDRNHNGISESGELAALTEAGITVLDLSYRETSRRDRYGNRYRYMANAFTRDKKGSSRRIIFDVFLRTVPR